MCISENEENPMKIILAPTTIVYDTRIVGRINMYIIGIGQHFSRIFLSSYYPKHRNSS